VAFLTIITHHKESNSLVFPKPNIKNKLSFEIDFHGASNMLNRTTCVERESPSSHCTSPVLPTGQS
jgi:hypothetical protein